MGFIEVIMNLRVILKNISICKKDIISYNPDAVILVDYPGFNMRIAKFLFEKKIPVLVDGCQAAPHLKLDMQELGCDFYAFSCHKMYGPTGVGILYAKKKWLDELPPYQGGGGMIEEVKKDKIR